MFDYFRYWRKVSFWSIINANKNPPDKLKEKEGWPFNGQISIVKTDVDFQFFIVFDSKRRKTYLRTFESSSLRVRNRWKSRIFWWSIMDIYIFMRICIRVACWSRMLDTKVTDERGESRYLWSIRKEEKRKKFRVWMTSIRRRIWSFILM